MRYKRSVLVASILILYNALSSPLDLLSFIDFFLLAFILSLIQSPTLFGSSFCRLSEALNPTPPDHIYHQTTHPFAPPSQLHTPHTVHAIRRIVRQKTTMRSLFQNGVMQTKLPSHLTRRATPPSRPQLHRTRHQRTKATESPNSSKDAHNPSSKNPDPQPKSSEPTGPPPAGTVASSAGAPTPPVTGPASRSLTQIIRTGPVGRVGRSYARMQERRPYWTQLYSSIVVYLAADLSAQFLFPSGGPVQPEDEGEEVKKDNDGEEDNAVAGKGLAYDPLRTLRHLFIGVTSSIPSYNWYVTVRSPTSPP